MNARAKPDIYEQTAREIDLVNRRSNVFEIENAKGREWLEDELAETAALWMSQILENYGAGDDLQNGVILRNCIGALADRIRLRRQAKELQEEFLPGWRSRVEP
jgi:hypothetical protein